MLPSETHKTGFVHLKLLNPSVPPPTPSCVEGTSPTAADTLPVYVSHAYFFSGAVGQSKGSRLFLADLFIVKHNPFSCAVIRKEDMWIFFFLTNSL